MLDTPLFLDRKRVVHFEKVAVTVKLPDDVTRWAPQVLSELHRQAPVMRNFHSEIVLDRTEPNKGAGFGYIIARPKTPDPMLDVESADIKIPIFIKNWMLSPLDIFFDSATGRGYYLSEGRIREVLQQTGAAAGIVGKDDPLSDDIRTMLTPPWENVGQFYRGVNTQVSQSAQTKTSSLLRQLGGTVLPEQLSKLASWVQSDEGKVSLWGRMDLVPVFRRALTIDPSEFHQDKVASSNGARVVQYRWSGGPMVQVKIAQPDGFAPQQGQVPAEQAAANMDPNMQAELAQNGQATAAPEVVAPETLEGDDFQIVSSFGVHRVITVNAEQIMGWVFPFILSYKMEKVPMQLFTDGTNFATQEQIAGVMISTNANLPNEQPQGRGFFYIIRNGKAFAFAPLDLQGEQQQPDGSVMFMGTTILGNNPIQIMKVDGMKAAAEMGEGQFAVPGDVRWCTFRQQTNPLITDPMQASQRAGAFVLAKAQQQQQMEMQQQQAQQQQGGRQKKASYIPITATVRMTQEGSLTLGGAAFDKLAHKYTHFLDYADAEWMLALAGVDPQYTREKVATLLTKAGGFMEVPCLRAVTPPQTISRPKTAALDSYAARFNHFMAKHAAEINDPNLADTLLALNFLNPRNISMFISYLPQFEETTSNLANLLVAARLGASEINEAACAESLRNIEDVIMGLRKLVMSREEV